MQQPIHRAALVSICLLAVGCAAKSTEEETRGEATSALAGTWSKVELGDGFRPSLSLDASGTPAVSLARGVPVASATDADMTPVFVSNDGTWRSGTGWDRKDIGVVPGKIDGFANSLGFSADSMGASSGAQIAFTSRTRADFNSGFILKFGRQTSLGWQFGNIEETPWIYQAVQRVKDGTTFVVYANTPQPGIQVAASADGVTWNKNILATIPHDLLSSIDAAVAPVSVKDATLGVATTTLNPTSSPAKPRGLHFASSADGGSSWGPVVDVDSSGAMIGPQVAYAGLRPQVAYTEVDAHRAKWASSGDGGLTWTVETIGTFGSNPATGLTVDRNGEPVVVIVVPETALGQDRLYLARRKSPGVWSLDLVDFVEHSLNLGFDANPRVAVTPEGRVAIAYAYGSVNVKHVRFAWSVPLF